MAKGKKRPAELPEYGTVMMKGVQYYRTRITDADGKRVAIYGLTREELYDRVEDAQKKIAEVVFHRENPTVEEYCEKWLLMRSGTVRTNTLEGYARMVNRYIVGPIGQMYMDEVTTDDLRLLMVPLSKGSSGMYGQLNMLIKNIFNSAEESKVIKENPSKTICARGGKPAKRREALTDEQTAILLDSIRELHPVFKEWYNLFSNGNFSDSCLCFGFFHIEPSFIKMDVLFLKVEEFPDTDTGINHNKDDGHIYV